MGKKLNTDGRIRKYFNFLIVNFPFIKEYINFSIANFPFICSNITAASAYGVYIFPLIQYYSVCGSYHEFLDRWLLLTKKLLNQGFLVIKLKSSLLQFCGPHHDLVNRYGISVSQMTGDMFRLSLSQSGPFRIQIYWRTHCYDNKYDYIGLTELSSDFISQGRNSC